MTASPRLTRRPLWSKGYAQRYSGISLKAASEGQQALLPSRITCTMNRKYLFDEPVQVPRYIRAHLENGGLRRAMLRRFWDIALDCQWLL